MHRYGFDYSLDVVLALGCGLVVGGVVGYFGGVLGVVVFGGVLIGVYVCLSSHVAVRAFRMGVIRHVKGFVAK